jgi:hypothetical protein
LNDEVRRVSPVSHAAVNDTAEPPRKPSYLDEPLAPQSARDRCAFTRGADFFEEWTSRLPYLRAAATVK